LNVAIVRRVSELQLAAILHELFKFGRTSLAELFKSGFLLLLFDVVVLFCLGASWEALPREFTSEEVNDNVTDAFQVVSTRLFITNMSVDRGVPCSTSQIFAITERDVLTF
jgi:hypothetical protein